MTTDSFADMAFSAPGVSSMLDVCPYPGRGCSIHTFQPLNTSNVTALKFQVFASAKRLSETPVFPADFFDLADGDTDWTLYPVLHIFDRLVNTVVVKVTALSGGPVSIRYVGSR